MTKQDFIKAVEQRTGLIYEKDYGFILGASSPFIEPGLLTEQRVDGFLIWKSTKDEDAFLIKTDNPDTYLDQVLTYLTTLVLEPEYLKTQGWYINAILDRKKEGVWSFMLPYVNDRGFTLRICPGYKTQIQICRFGGSVVYEGYCWNKLYFEQICKNVLLG